MSGTTEITITFWTPFSFWEYQVLLAAKASD